MSDELLTAFSTMNYYTRLIDQNGGYPKLQENVRLFMLPGTPHCSMGGFGPNSFDALTALEGWVENGIAPGSATVEWTHALLDDPTPFGRPEYQEAASPEFGAARR